MFWGLDKAIPEVSAISEYDITTNCLSEVVTDHDSTGLVLGQPKWCKGFIIFNSVRKHAQRPDFDVGKGIR